MRPRLLPHRRRFSGRDPDEQHRTATPLELFYDLTIVVAFGTAADELAHFIADAHVGAGIAGFAFATFMVVWAWLNYTWFASAYDIDDWRFRIATMVQMVGVIILTLGLPKMFDSIDDGVTLDNGVMVAGYVVMRAPLLFLWWQASRHDPRSAPAARIYMVTIATALVGWVALIFLELPVVRDVPPVHRADRGRGRRPGGRRTQGPHSLARAPHRRALRPADDHHARRGHHRHGRRPQRARERRGGLEHRSRAARRSPASASRSAAGGCTSRCPGPSRSSATASAGSSSATGTP